MSKALFLDRDGVINVDHGYVSNPDDFEFVNGIFDLCKRFTEAGYQLVVVTNQSGIARGMYTEADFRRLTDWMCGQFSQQGLKISGVFYCPHHPEKGLDQYREQCDCRKPHPGMFFQAEKQLGIELRESVMLGDKLSDLQASEAAGLKRHILFAYDSNPYIKDISLPDGIEVVASLAGITI